jgi:hypothetical protein
MLAADTLVSCVKGILQPLKFDKLYSTSNEEYKDEKGDLWDQRDVGRLLRPY